MAYILIRIARSQRGASLAEYGLLAMLIAIVALVAVRFVGVEVDRAYEVIGDSIAAATN